MAWLTVDNLEILFANLIGTGKKFNMEDLLKAARIIQPYTGPKGAKTERELTPEELRRGHVMSRAVGIWCRRLQNKQQPLAPLEHEIRELFKAENMPIHCWDCVEKWFADAKAKKTPVEAPEIDDPIQGTGEGSEAPPVDAQPVLSVNSGVQVGDGSEVEDEIPF